MTLLFGIIFTFLFLELIPHADTKYEVASVQKGGFLQIHQIESAQDSGVYTCIVRNRGGEEGRREIELTVNSK